MNASHAPERSSNTESNAAGQSGSPGDSGSPPTAPAGQSVEAAKSPSEPSEAPAAPALDLTSLEERLKDTRAIGVFTKLSLKNQVDDLLAQFKAFHSKHGGMSLAQLRQKYDLLVLKVLSVLQEGDPKLAAAISASREAIWGILVDPAKFSRI